MSAEPAPGPAPRPTVWDLALKKAKEEEARQQVQPLALVVALSEAMKSILHDEGLALSEKQLALADDATAAYCRQVLEVHGLDPVGRPLASRNRALWDGRCS